MCCNLWLHCGLRSVIIFGTYMATQIQAERQVIPTFRQRKLAKELIKNAKADKPLNKGQLLVKVGYSKNVSNTRPQAILEQAGVKKSLAEYGLTEELITTSLVIDIDRKPQNRLGELKLGADILGMTKTVDGGSKTLVINISGESASRYGLLDNVKDSLSKLDEPKKD